MDAIGTSIKVDLDRSFFVERNTLVDVFVSVQRNVKWPVSLFYQNKHCLSRLKLSKTTSLIFFWCHFIPSNTGLAQVADLTPRGTGDS